MSSGEEILDKLVKECNEPAEGSIKNSMIKLGKRHGKKIAKKIQEEIKKEIKKIPKKLHF